MSKRLLKGRKTVCWRSALASFSGLLCISGRPYAIYRQLNDLTARRSLEMSARDRQGLVSPVVQPHTAEAAVTVASAKKIEVSRRIIGGHPTYVRPLAKVLVLQ